MSDQILDDVVLAIQFDLADRPTTVREIVAMSASDLGMFILAGMGESRRGDWSSGNMGALAQASISFRRQSGQMSPSSAIVGQVIVDAIADGMGWLISAALVGPASAQSGSSAEWRVTTAGRAALERGSTSHVEATRRLHVDLHPALQGATRMNFERGELAAAVLIAMKEVEVALRKASDLPAKLTGKSLATEALREGGPFRINGETPDEQDGYMFLFMGAAAALRNPNGHRAVEYSDATEVADIIHFADLLLRMIDRETRAREASPTASPL